MGEISHPELQRFDWSIHSVAVKSKTEESEDDKIIVAGDKGIGIFLLK